MECSCDCYTDDFDGPKIFQEEYRVARKEHKCCECHRIINKGEKYEYVKGLWEDHWDNYKTCLQCSNIRKDIAPCSPFGYLREELWECLDFDYITNESRVEEE